MKDIKQPACGCPRTLPRTRAQKLALALCTPEAHAKLVDLSFDQSQHLVDRVHKEVSAFLHAMGLIVDVLHYLDVL